MIWLMTKGSNDSSCSYWVRSWLKTRPLRRIWLGLIVTGVIYVLAGFLVNATIPQAVYDPYTGIAHPDSPWKFLLFIGWIPIGFVLVDWLVDIAVVSNDLSLFENGKNVVLATRGEYRGGHPMLPRARFVYLLMSGTLEQPTLELYLPGGSFNKQTSFMIPIMDVGKTRSLLTHVIDHNMILGKTPIFEIEYTGTTGRKHRVEFSHFYRGAEEVYLWRNFVVCIQHEADSGEVPFGAWKSLPKPAPEAESAQVSQPEAVPIA